MLFVTIVPLKIAQYAQYQDNFRAPEEITCSSFVALRLQRDTNQLGKSVCLAGF